MSLRRYYIAFGLFSLVGLVLARKYRQAFELRSKLLKLASSNFFLDVCLPDSAQELPSSAPSKSLPQGVQFSHFLFSILPISAQRWLRDHWFDPLTNVSVAILGLILLGPKRIREVLTGLNSLEFAYGSLPEHRLEVFHPNHSNSSRPLPVVVFIHGGAWGSGRKLFYREIAFKMARGMNCIVCLVGYRVWPVAHCQQQIEDVERALVWTASNIQAVAGGDPNLIFLAGHSSGAHISCMTLLKHKLQSISSSSSPSSALALNLSSNLIPHFLSVAGLITLSAPFSPVDHFEFERARGVHEVSPMGAACHPLEAHCCTRLVAAHHQSDSPSSHPILPPCLLIHGDADDVVPHAASVLFARALLNSDSKPTALESASAIINNKSFSPSFSHSSSSTPLSSSPSCSPAFPLPSSSSIPSAAPLVHAKPALPVAVVNNAQLRLHLVRGADHAWPMLDIVQSSSESPERNSVCIALMRQFVEHVVARHRRPQQQNDQRPDEQQKSLDVSSQTRSHPTERALVLIESKF